MTLISEKHQSVIIDAVSAPHISSVIPTAKRAVLGGKDSFVVPHRYDETRVLRNLGFDVPNPVRTHYKWPGQYKPFHAQIETVDFLTMNPRAFCLNQMGTGKTAATLWAFDYLRQEGKVRRMLVISPLSTLERTWGDEIFRHFTGTKFAVLHGSVEIRLKRLEEKHDIYLINHDGIKTKGFLQALANRHDIDLIVVDEVAAFRNSGTSRWQVLHTICNKQTSRMVWGLTGTPTPNAPTDAWAQCRLVVPNSVPPYYSKFRDVTMKQISTYKWVPRVGALDVVREAMQPSVLFTRDDCMDLPPVIFERRSVALSTEQAAAYKSMLLKYHTEYAGGSITASNEAIKLSKLLQICCGVAYGDGKSEVQFPATARIEVTKEIIEEAGAKVIVFVPFTAAIDTVARELAKDFSVEVIQGSTSKRKRDDIFHCFQTMPDPRVIVAQPGTMSHGLTLTAANTIIWYAPIHSNDIYNQAIARITRPGQTRTQLIVTIEGSEVERHIYSRLKSKTHLQGILLDMLKGDTTHEL